MPLVGTLFLPCIEKEFEGDCGGEALVGIPWWGGKGVPTSKKRGATKNGVFCIQLNYKRDHFEARRGSLPNLRVKTLWWGHGGGDALVGKLAVVGRL